MACMKNTKYVELACKMREIPLDMFGPSYEWEELVEKLCASNDAGLREIGVRELEILRQECPHCPVFSKS